MLIYSFLLPRTNSVILTRIYLLSFSRSMIPSMHSLFFPIMYPPVLDPMPVTLYATPLGSMISTNPFIIFVLCPWLNFNVPTMKHFQSCYFECTQTVSGYRKYNNVTAMVLELYDCLLQIMCFCWYRVKNQLVAWGNKTFAVHAIDIYDFLASSTNLLLLQLQNLEHLRRISDLVTCCNIVHQFNISPFNDFVTFSDAPTHASLQTYSVWVTSNSRCWLLKMTLESFSFFFSSRIVLVWNSGPLKIAPASNTTQFKALLYSHVFNLFLTQPHLLTFRILNRLIRDSFHIWLFCLWFFVCWILFRLSRIENFNVSMIFWKSFFKRSFFIWTMCIMFVCKLK